MLGNKPGNNNYDNITQADLCDSAELTRSELKLLAAKLDPQNCLLPVTQLCKKAGVSTDTYYRAIKKEAFNRELKQTALEMVKDLAVNVLHQTYKYAMASVKNHQDRRLLLEMAEFYTEKTRSELTGAEGQDFKVIFNVPERKPRPDID